MTAERWQHLLSLPGVLVSNTLFYASVASRGPLSDTDINTEQQFPHFNLLRENTDREGCTYNKVTKEKSITPIDYISCWCHPSIFIHMDVRNKVTCKCATAVRNHDGVSNVLWVLSHICKIYSWIFFTRWCKTIWLPWWWLSDTGTATMFYIFMPVRRHPCVIQFTPFLHWFVYEAGEDTRAHNEEQHVSKYGFWYGFLWDDEAFMCDQGTFPK